MRKVAISERPGVPPDGAAGTTSHHSGSDLDGRLETAPGLVETLIELVPTPALLVDASGAVVCANVSGRRLLAVGDGLGLEPPRLVAAHAAETRALRAAIYDSTRAGGTACGRVLLVRRPSGACPMRVTVQPVVGRSAAATRVCLIMVGDTAHQLKVCPQALMLQYGLTLTQSRLAVLLAEGRSTSEVMAALEISRNTASSHLKQIFAKTGCARQAALVVKILRSASALQPIHTAAPCSAGDRLPAECPSASCWEFAHPRAV
jgi:DNA-binding CsgD family transcriptional regulator